MLLRGFAAGTKQATGFCAHPISQLNLTSAHRAYPAVSHQTDVPSILVLGHGFVAQSRPTVLVALGQR